MPIVGLHGKIGSGKNTVADRLEALFPGQIKPVSFFARLKAAAAELLGVTVEELEAWKNEPQMLVTVAPHGYGAEYGGPTVRSFLQRLGDVFRDLYGENYLIDDALPLDGDYEDFIYVVTDVRLPVEAERIRELGGKLLAVAGRATWERGPERTHRSEQPIACDEVVENAGEGFDALDREICRALDKLGYVVQGHRFEGIAP